MLCTTPQSFGCAYLLFVSEKNVPKNVRPQMNFLHTTIFNIILKFFCLSAGLIVFVCSPPWLTIHSSTWTPAAHDDEVDNLWAAGADGFTQGDCHPKYQAANGAAHLCHNGGPSGAALCNILWFIQPQLSKPSPPKLLAVPLGNELPKTTATNGEEDNRGALAGANATSEPLTATGH